ncbi:MAG: hypothetical protein BGO67_07855 [Alphaproteobacteria bacterium 41-28]|nr:MAG: hypothetical protein BGO67_07855 [Alphaproteobacteria bacterium 41-28]
MQENAIYLPDEIYFNDLETIDNVRFSRREIDVIACLFKGRSTKKIARILSISPKTVATHLRNIMLKLEVNSREAIIDFIEKSNKINTFQMYYNNLLLFIDFECVLEQISKLIDFETPTYSLVFWKDQEESYFFIPLLKTHLSIVGIMVLLDEKEGKEGKQIPYLIKQPKQPQSLPIFLFFNTDFFKKDDSQKEYVDLYEQGNYYLLFLELLKKLLPSVELDETILTFNQSFENNKIADQRYLLAKGEDKDEPEKPFSQPSLSGQKKKRRFLQIGSIVLSLFLITFIIFKFLSPDRETGQDSHLIRSDLILPSDRTLLNRTEQLAQLENKFKEREGIQTVALVGIGGAGKTTLARQFARQQKMNTIWEINAETKASLIASFEKLAEVLSITKEDQIILKGLIEIKDPIAREEKHIQFVKERLKSRSPWFLVFDNVESFLDIQKYFPYDVETWGKGKIIITTRDSNIQNNSYITDSMEVGRLDPDQMLNLFMRIMKHNDKKPLVPIQVEEIKAALKEIPPFPLDVTLAADYIQTANISLPIYINNLNNYSNEFNDVLETVLKGSNLYTKTRYKIIALSLQRLIETHPDFAGLLLLISHLDSQNIPRELLEEFKGKIITDNFIYNLKRHSLILEKSSKENESISEFSIHRSIQQVCSIYLNNLKRKEQEQKKLDVLASFLIQYLDKLILNDDIPRIKGVVSHIETFLKHSEFISASERCILEGKLGFIYLYLGRFLQSIKILKNSLSICIECYGNKHVKTAWIMRALGLAYKSMGELDAGITFLENSLTIYRRHYGDKNEETVETTFSLGILYRAMCHYRNAKSLLEEGVAFFEKKYGKSHIKVAWVLAQLGVLYKRMGYYHEAVNTFERAIAIYKIRYSSIDIYTSWVLVGLGDVYRILGDQKKALQALHQSLEVVNEYYGYKNQQAALVYICIGNAYKKLGNYEKALALLKEGNEIYSAHFGTNHIETAWSSIHLGSAYRVLGNYSKAKELLEHGFRINLKKFGENHISTAWARLHLGNLYRDLGDYKNAKSFLEKSLLIYEEYYGSHHIEVAKVLNSLGQTYFSEGYKEMGEAFLRKAFVIFQKNNHPESKMVLKELENLKSSKAADNENKTKIHQVEAYKTKAINYLNKKIEEVKFIFSSEF